MVARATEKLLNTFLERTMTNKFLTAVIDMDAIKYACAGVGEKRSIIVKHLSTGREREFSNRTDFYGRNTQGGWLSKLNKSRAEQGKDTYSPSEFVFTDVQTPEPIGNVLHTARLMFEKNLELFGSKKYKAFLGKGDSFRLGRSTLLKYKGNRDNTLRPLHLDAVTEYLTKKYKPEIVTGIEADDALVMECFGSTNNVVLGIDKDYYGQPIKFFNTNRPQEGVVDGNCLGSLWIDCSGASKKVRGHGFLHLAYQILAGDSSDNYKANCFSSVKYGDMSAFKDLEGCVSYNSTFKKVESVLQRMYPEPKTVTGWRGDTITIDWEYVAEEMWSMARMLRYDGDTLKFKEASSTLPKGGNPTIF